MLRWLPKKILPQNEVIFPKFILEIWRKFAANFHFENKKCFLAEKELRLSKVSYDTVQKRYRIGRSGIALIMNRYNDSGLSLDDLRQMPASKVVDLIYPKENLRHKDIPLPDFEKIHEQMIQMGKHADLSFLWIDYKKEHPNGYQLAQFYKLYRDFMINTYGTSKTSMPVERIPGEKMYIDWVGDQPELLLDTTTGGLRKVHIFTTTLGFSSLVYAEIFLDEKLPHFIAGTVHALSYYGAVPKYLVPDNLKTAVTRHSKYELVLQSAFSDLGTFYDTIILPPPPRKPKGKPTVENHVRFLETHLVEELKKDTYTSLEALNAAVKKIVEDINQRPFQKKSDIRSSSHDITLTPQEQALIMRLKSFCVPEMAHILEEQLKDPNADLNTFMERMTAMVDAEWQARADKRFNRLMKEAHLRYPAADLDETIYRPERQLDTQTIEQLSTCQWIEEGKNLIVTGSSASGKLI